MKDSESSLPILRLYKKLHTVYVRFLLNKLNSFKINNDLYIILGKFKYIFIEVKLKLKNINQILIDLKVIYEILTKDYSRI
jgi:hypothetical protein